MDLLTEIEAFMSAHGMSERLFGVEALGDNRLLATLRAGRSPSLATAERLRTFMRTYPNHEAYVPRTRKIAA